MHGDSCYVCGTVVSLIALNCECRIPVPGHAEYRCQRRMNVEMDSGLRLRSGENYN